MGGHSQGQKKPTYSRRGHHQHDEHPQRQPSPEDHKRRRRLSQRRHPQLGHGHGPIPPGQVQRIQILHFRDDVLQEMSVRKWSKLHIPFEPCGAGGGPEILVVLLADLPESCLVEGLIVLEEDQTEIELAVGASQLPLGHLLLGGGSLPVRWVAGYSIGADG